MNTTYAPNEESEYLSRTEQEHVVLNLFTRLKKADLVLDKHKARSTYRFKCACTIIFIFKGG